MRHNKLAGTRFLLGSRKHKPSTFTTSSKDTTQNMLHSKSTYFYRWFGEHLDLAVSGLSAKTSYIVPAVCGAALLCGIGIIFNPVIGNIETAYAAEEDSCKTSENPNTGICAMELAIFMNGTDGAYNELPATELSADNVVHRDYNFSVRAVDTKDGYDLYAGVVNTGSFGNNLVNADYPTEEHMIKALSGTDVAYSSIGNNEWGYAITSTNQAPEDLSYNSLPVATITTEDDKTTLTNGKLLAHGEDTGYDPSQPVGEDKHTDQDYKLYFAAKATPESPAGHYRTQVMLSLVANPKSVGTLTSITKMSALTSSVCQKTPTPAAQNKDGSINADVPTTQLIDDREGSDGDKYWVAKLADGNCWMTQNMAYDGISNTSGNFRNDKKSTLEIQTDAIKAGDKYAGTPIPEGYTLSDDPAMNTALDDNAKTYNGHYLLGNYYTADNGQAVSACTFPSNTDWKLPIPSDISIDSPHGSFGRLFASYNIGNNVSGDATMYNAPFYMPHPGEFVYNAFYSIGKIGNYRSTIDKMILRLYYKSFSNPNYLESNSDSTSRGFSVRCVVSGE